MKSPHNLSLLFIVSIFIFSCNSSEKKNELSSVSEPEQDTTSNIKLDTFPKSYVFRNINFLSYWIESDKVNSVEELYDSAFFEWVTDSSVYYEYFPKNKRSKFLKANDTLVFSSLRPVEFDSVFVGFKRPSGNEKELIVTDEGAITLFRSSWWLCSNPACEWEHGHMQQNETMYISEQFGVICWFSQIDPHHISVLSSVNGNLFDPEILIQALSQYKIDPRIMDKIGK